MWKGQLHCSFSVDGYHALFLQDYYKLEEKLPLLYKSYTHGEFMHKHYQEKQWSALQLGIGRVL
jgi:hypothetical protein